MNCPHCENIELSPIQAGPVKLDVCKNGCGGVWFDKGELSHVDESQEAVSEEALRPLSNAEVAINVTREIDCPKCSVALAKVDWDSERKICVDECQDCGGLWLNLGELAQLRNLNKLHADRSASIKAFSEKLTDEAAKKKYRAVLQLIF